ncbi:hypothetical protein Q5752_003475 [Cryptotrichosporon argae]
MASTHSTYAASEWAPDDDATSRTSNSAVVSAPRTGQRDVRPPLDASAAVADFFSCLSRRVLRLDDLTRAAPALDDATTDAYAVWTTVCPVSEASAAAQASGNPQPVPHYRVRVSASPSPSGAVVIELTRTATTDDDGEPRPSLPGHNWTDYVLWTGMHPLPNGAPRNNLARTVDTDTANYAGPLYNALRMTPEADAALVYHGVLDDASVFTFDDPRGPQGSRRRLELRVCGIEPAGTRAPPLEAPFADSSAGAQSDDSSVWQSTSGWRPPSVPDVPTDRWASPPPGYTWEVLREA